MMKYDCGSGMLDVWKWWVFEWVVVAEGVVAVVAGPRPKIPVVAVELCVELS